MHHDFPKTTSSITFFNIDNNNKCLLIKSTY